MIGKSLTPGTESFKKLSEKFSLIPLKGKIPIEKNWQKHCNTKREFQDFKNSGHNTGVCCGPASGVLVLDIDDENAFNHLIETNGLELPETYTVRTGGGGLHHYFNYPSDGERYGNRTLNHPAFGGHTICDIRGDGGFVVAAGSIHPVTGKRYEVEKEVPIVEAPEWLLRYSLFNEINLDALWNIPLPFPVSKDFVQSLKVSKESKELILQGTEVGKRSEAIGKVLGALNGAGYNEKTIFFIFDHYQIGEKYREKGQSKTKWLRDEISRSKDYTGEGHRLRTNNGSGQEQSDCPEFIEELNQKHAVVMLGGKCVVLNEDFDPVLMRKDITFSSTEDFHKRYANRKEPNPYSAGNAQTPISKIWLESPDRRQYDGIVFSPDKDVPGYYNLYRGLGVDPSPGDWSLMQRHINDVIAGGNKEIEQYILMWMADLVQNPGGQRHGTAIVLRGKQGTGKGSFVSQLGRIIGPHYLHITNQHQLTGRFNNHLKDALLIFVDEGFWGGDKTIEGPLKGLVTEDQIMIEPKGKDPFMVQNHIRLIIASNNDWVVPAGLEERRFFVIDVVDNHIQDRGYFNQLFKQMDSGGREAMLYDLLQMDISSYDLRSFPRTGALFDQIFRSMSSFEQFWYEQLWSGTLGSPGTIWRNSISVRELHEDYIEFCKNRGLRHRQNKSQMGKELKKLCPGLDKKRKQADKNNDRISEYIIPKLDECRKAFEERVKVELAWDKLE